MMTLDEIVANAIRNIPYPEKETFSKEAKAHKKKISDTFSDEYPEYLNLSRPRQSEKQKEYRKAFFEAVGNPIKVFTDRLITKLSVIFESEYFGINYYDNKESLKVKNFIESNRYFDWYKDNIFRLHINEPNGVLFVFSQNIDGKIVTEMLFEPLENVYLFSEELVVIKSTSKAWIDKVIIDKDGKKQTIQAKEGDIYFCIEKNKYTKVVKDLDRSIENISVTEMITNDFSKSSVPNKNKMITAIKTGAFLQKKNNIGDVLNISLIDKAIVFLRNAQFHYLDYNTNLAYGVNNLLWLAGNKKCVTCNGRGKVANISNTNIENICKTCNGEGSTINTFNGGADEVLVLPMQSQGTLLGDDNANNVKLPTTAGGYIKGDPEPARVYDEFYDKEIEKAFFAVMMETIVRKTTQGSARQKELEKEEISDFLKVVAAKVCGDLQSIFKWLTVNFLDGNVPDNSVVPSVAIPTEFNFYSEKELLDIINETQKDGTSATYRISVSEKLVEKQSGKFSVELKRERLNNKINPLAGRSEVQQVSALPTLEWFEVILANRSLNLILSAEREDANFWNEDVTDNERITKIIEKAKDIAGKTLENRDREYKIRSQTDIININ